MNENIYCLITNGIVTNTKYHNRQKVVSGSIAIMKRLPEKIILPEMTSTS